MFRKTLTVTVAALTIAGSSLTTTSSAQAGGLGKFVAAAIVGTVVGAVAAGSSRSQEQGYRSEYRPFAAAMTAVCGFRNSPVFDEDGNRIGSRRVPAC